MRISDWSSDVCSSDLQLLHELAGRAAEEDLRAAAFAAHAGNDRARPVADAKHLARDLLVAADHAFRPAQVDDDMAKLHPLHHAGDDLVHAVLELFILPLALGVADLLEDHLLGGLGSNAADRKSTRLNSSHYCAYRMPSSA